MERFPEHIDEHSSSSEDTCNIASEHSGSSKANIPVKIRRHLRAWHRMQPQVMINKQLGAAQRAPPGRQRFASSHLESDKEDQPLVPGQTRVRVGQSSAVREIVGDSESSSTDLDSPTPHDHRAEDSGSSSSDEAIEILPNRLPGPHRSGSSMSDRPNERGADVYYDYGNSTPNSSGINIRRHRGPHSRGHRAKGGVQKRKEVDMVDWMLSRTRAPSGRKSGRTESSATQPVM
jgi:hypothetical protein